MDLRKRILTKNDCYKTGRKISVKGLMLHSTGANNPKLSRYVDAPDLGKVSSNHWNQPRPGGRQVCVHGFIGKDQNNNIATYQTLPWNHRGWGGGGSSNNTHIHVEICEDDMKSRSYFDAVYREAVELFAYLCREFNLDPLRDIITHSEGYKKGIASNHGDVMHWFPKHGKSMDTFRNDVKIMLNNPKEGESKLYNPNSKALLYSTEEVLKSLVKEGVISDLWVKKLNDGTLTESEATGLLYVAMQRKFMK